MASALIDHVPFISRRISERFCQKLTITVGGAIGCSRCGFMTLGQNLILHAKCQRLFPIHYDGPEPLAQPIARALTGSHPIHWYVNWASRVKYADARDVAQILNEMFGASGTSGTIDSASSQIASGGGVTTTSNGSGGAATITPAERLTGGPMASWLPAADGQIAGGGSRALSSPRGASGTAALLPDVRITADVTNNSLSIYASEENYLIIEGALRQINRPQLQVAFDATIAKVTLNDSLTYGVQFLLKSTNVGAPPDTGSAINTIGGAAAGAVLSRVLPGFNILIGSKKTPQIVIDALHGVTDVKILSNPSLVVVDNGVATLQVGDQVPITTGTATVLSANNAVVTPSTTRTPALFCASFRASAPITM